MLVSELKNEMKKYNKNDLEKIIVELYKRIPKSKKEDYDIDSFIKNLDNPKVEKKEIDFEYLKKEIFYFIRCVDQELYCTPNRIISKKERSSWRFKVKRYYKELTGILPDSPNGGMATLLLIDIFKRLSTGSNTLLFVNWDTFRALGVSQDDYYDVILKRILCSGYTKDNLKQCLNLLSVPKDPNNLSYDMYAVFFANLKTTFNKEDAIDLIKDKIIELKEKSKEKNNRDTFYFKEQVNNYVKLTTNIFISLGETEKGIRFFHNNYIEKDKEVKEYVLLSELEEMNLKDEWIKEYEQNKDKVDFRKSLNIQYQEWKRN